MTSQSTVTVVPAMASPNITGNIGSCTTQVEKVTVREGVFRETGFTIATNSCTGAVDRIEYSEIAVTGVLGMFFGFFFGIVILLAILANIFD